MGNAVTYKAALSNRLCTWRDSINRRDRGVLGGRGGRIRGLSGSCPASSATHCRFSRFDPEAAYRVGRMQARCVRLIVFVEQNAACDLLPEEVGGLTKPGMVFNKSVI
jgi:hypothetical protein